MTSTADFSQLTDDANRPARAIMTMGQRLIGFGVITASVLTAIALASWNVEDPSLTHATDGPLTNLLGFPGAVVSDLLFQFFGIAAALLAFLPSLWGWRTMRRRPMMLGFREGMSFVGLIVLTCGLAACLPAPSTWPMPTGLGGLIGNALLALPIRLIGGDFAGSVSLAFAVFFALPIPFLFLRAFFAKKPARANNLVGKKAPRAVIARETTIESLSENDDAEDREGNLLPMLAGAVFHGAYSLKAQFRHLFASRRRKIQRQHVPIHDQTMDGGFEDAALSGGLRARLSELKRKLIDEPIADDGLGDYLAQNPAQNPAQNLVRGRADNGSAMVAAFAKAGDIASDAASIAHAGTSPGSSLRVAPPAERPRPGKRALSEAQPKLPVFADEADFTLPPLHLLTPAPANRQNHGQSEDALSQNAEMLEGVLDDFGVKGEIVQVRPGPVVTLYELEPAPGIKSSRVIGLADDIARSMSAIAARVAVIPGKNAIGIELPNANRETVYLHESLSSKSFETNKGKLPICLGKTIGGEPVIADLARMPHLLVAGTTGSGKSVAINTMILSLLFRMTPQECKLIMIDPKMLELSVYDGIPHLLTPVVTDPKKAVVALKWTVREMEDRYRKMSKVGVRNIDGFNARIKMAVENGEPIVRTIQTGYDQETGEAIYEREELDLSPLPFIVVIIDEMADLMMVAGKDIEGAIQRLAQMARAAGIHVIMATQRPSVDVITGTIKANFPTRISFQVTSKIDSRTILAEQGAEQLLGMGDMLYMAGGGRIQRVHGPFVSDQEVEDVVRHLKDQGIPQYLGAVTEDVDGAEAVGEQSLASTGNLSDDADPYDQAVAVVLRDKKASTSYIQRRLGIGYNRAASIIERMEQEGIVGPANHAGKRDILVGSDPDDNFSDDN
ncbi:MAG: DNA translocase FtsK [Rhizobiales bacterium]|nr:DNA translocase FtsK [Hyphomicrobiales bacterium]